MYRKFVKRFLDLIICISLLPILFLILLILGPTIYCEDRGPIFYRANRLGENGRFFKMIKFRSMEIDAQDIRNLDGSTYSAEDDQRITRIGKVIRKTSLDEFPQILNVIVGDMSIVGPRPDLTEHLELYEEDEIRKLEIKPGITGYNQAYFRNIIPWKERIRNDIYYVDHVSFSLDLKIIFRTFISVLKCENIFTDRA